MKQNSKHNANKSLNDLFTNHSYSIDISVRDDEEKLSVPERSSFAYHVSDLSRRYILGLFNLVAKESLKDNCVEDTEDEFGNIVNTLFENFSLKHLDGSGSLEGSLSIYIKELKKKLFYIPDELVEKSQIKLKPNAVGMLFCDLNTIQDIFREILESLRTEKIKFWENLFEVYKNDKEGYNLEFRTKVSRHKKDLDRISKITDEDIESLL